MSISVGSYNHHPGYPTPTYPSPDFYPPQYAHTPTRYDQQPESYMSWMLNPGPPHHDASVMDCGGGYASNTPDLSSCAGGIIRQYDFYGNLIHFRGVKRRVTANKKERRRTESINGAFAQLRGCIPNVPSDTKLSKIKTLRLATSYISYLMELLSKDDPVLENTFKADLQRKNERRHQYTAQQKSKSQTGQKVTDMSGCGPQTCHQGSDGSDTNSENEKRGKGRTGWPQAVWAAELK